MNPFNKMKIGEMLIHKGIIFQCTVSKLSACCNELF